MRKGDEMVGRGFSPGGGVPPQGVMQKIQQAMSLHRVGKLNEAEKIYSKALKVAPKNPDLLQLYGALKKQKGDLLGAEKMLRNSLSINKNQPHVWNNLGNVLQAAGKGPEAVDCYQTAIRQNAQYAEAHFNLGILYDGESAFIEAEREFKKAIAIQPSYAAAFNALGLTLKKVGRLDDAVKAFEGAIKLFPNYAEAFHNLAVVLRDLDRCEDALVQMIRATELNPDCPETRYNLGNLFFLNGKTKESISNYRRAIELRPDYEDAHESLKKVLWAEGRSNEIVRDFDIASRLKPESADILYFKGHALYQMESYDHAEEVFRTALKINDKHARSLDGLGRVLTALGRADEAVGYQRSAVTIDGKTPFLYLNYAKSLMTTEDYKEALKVLMECGDLPTLYSDFMDQEHLAILALCYRYMGDERSAYLNDYDRFVGTEVIPPPPGYESLEEFNEVLIEELLKYHTTKEHPIDQTLRNGTQTEGNLFEYDSRIIQQLRSSIKMAIDSYVSKLDDDTEHPFLKRKTTDLVATSSWSVRLRSQGFHTNHIHPMGWMSCCYYVDVPDEIKTTNSHNGWIKFGEPKVADEGTLAEHWIQPASGVLACFPSYFWHGTHPYQSDAFRITTPSDWLPAEDAVHLM